MIESQYQFFTSLFYFYFSCNCYQLKSIFSAGVKSCVVALLAQKAEINYDKTVLNASQVVGYINSLVGFESRIIEDDAARHNKLELHVSLNTFNKSKI